MAQRFAAARTRRPSLLWLAVLLLGGVTACGRTVDVPPVSGLSPAAVATCQALNAELPDETAAGRRWQVSPDNGTTAAWGSPPVTLRCGTAPPSGYDQTATVAEVGGVRWLPVVQETGTDFLLLERPVGLQVSVPDQYQPPAEVLADLSGPITRAWPE